MLMPSTIHPTSRVLVAYLDGELPVDERREVAGHLGNCQSCRAELDSIEADLDWFLVLDAASHPVEPPAAGAGLDQLLMAARQWRSQHPEAAEAAAEVRRSVEERLAEASGMLFGPTVAAADDESTQSLLSAFLGKRAAKALMAEIRRGADIERFLTAGTS